MLLQKKQVAGLVDSLSVLQTSIANKAGMTDVNNAISVAISALVNGAPTALDTLNELATRLQGEETALNALLVTVNGKASIAYVDGLIGTINASISALQSAVSVADGKATTAQTTADAAFAKATTAQTTADAADVKAVAAKTLADALAIQVAGKLSGVKNIAIHQDINWAGYGAYSTADITLPTDSNQALEVKVNGQFFSVETGGAFSIFAGGVASTLANGKYVVNNFLHIDGSKLGFTLEATDKIYVTLVSTL